jgi:hypothetical protein
MKTRLDRVRYGFDMNLLDSGNENEANPKMIYIGTSWGANAESALVIIHKV